MTDADMKNRYEISDPTILVNWELGPRNHGQFSLRLVARRVNADRISVSLERWHQPYGDEMPRRCDVVQHFEERELDRLIWALNQARDEVHSYGRKTSPILEG